MLSTLTLTFENDKRMHYNAGSLMQGLLMEQIHTEYAEKLHQSKMHPYSQHLTFEPDKICWKISTLTQEAREQIILPFLTQKTDKLKIKHLDLELIVQNKNMKELNYDVLMDKTYFGRCKPYITLDFITPTAFKVDGKYQFYPTVFHIFQSLAKKYDAVSGETEIFSDQLMKEID